MRQPGRTQLAEKPPPLLGEVHPRLPAQMHEQPVDGSELVAQLQRLVLLRADARRKAQLVFVLPTVQDVVGRIEPALEDFTPRYAPGEAMPWLAGSMAPRLSDDPDALVDDLLAFARARPPAAMAEHYDAVFAWLCERVGATCWVERSGSSVDYAADLLAMFPDALVVHLHRDGDETALSIRDHPFYRLAVALLFDLWRDDLDEDAAISHAIETPPPVEVAGRYWSEQVERGVAALAGLPADRCLTVRFEDLLADPPDTMVPLASFLQPPVDADFADSAAALVGTPPPSRMDRIDAGERAALHAATAPGRALLGR